MASSGGPSAGDGIPSRAGASPDVREGSLAWKAPARWRQVPNPSSMRLATYRAPKVEGDSEEPEMAVSQAGGGVDANVDRWLGQFDAAARANGKRTTKKVAGMNVTIVEIEGVFSGGMGAKGPEEKAGWALVGVIVETPEMPHFFKLLGPVKSVRAARAGVDELVASFSTH